ncbi:MAG: DinB family protein [Chloroflexia bacterium]|nr:DinB family protein [Chloroflexia bacterium]
MTFSWNHALLDQLAFAWDVQFLPRMADLTDAEYLWEPVPGGWSVRPDGAGSWKPDWAKPEPDPPPFTTIAWRLAHIATFFGERASNHFGDGSFDPATVAWTGSADDALRIVRAEYARWRDGVRGLGEDGLFRPCGPAEGPYADEPFLMLVLHINREFLHHAAEVALLRDLYRETAAKASRSVR